MTPDYGTPAVAMMPTLSLVASQDVPQITTKLASWQFLIFSALTCRHSESPGSAQLCPSPAVQRILIVLALPRTKPTAGYPELKKFLRNLSITLKRRLQLLLRALYSFPDSKVHGANMGSTWVLSAPDGPHVNPMKLAIRVDIFELQ